MRRTLGAAAAESRSPRTASAAAWTSAYEHATSHSARTSRRNAPIVLAAFKGLPRLPRAGQAGLLDILRSRIQEAVDCLALGSPAHVTDSEDSARQLAEPASNMDPVLPQ